MSYREEIIQLMDKVDDSVLKRVYKLLEYLYVYGK